MPHDATVTKPLDRVCQSPIYNVLAGSSEAKKLTMRDRAGAERDWRLEPSVPWLRAEGDPTRRRALEAAKGYLDKVFGLWTADHLYRASHPYLDQAHEWGYHRFYNDWQGTMLRHAAALKGVRWLE